MYGPLRVYYGAFEKENWYTDLHLQGELILKVERLS